MQRAAQRAPWPFPLLPPCRLAEPLQNPCLAPKPLFPHTGPHPAASLTPCACLCSFTPCASCFPYFPVFPPSHEGGGGNTVARRRDGVGGQSHPGARPPSAQTPRSHQQLSPSHRLNPKPSQHLNPKPRSHQQLSPAAAAVAASVLHRRDIDVTKDVNTHMNNISNIINM